MAEGVIQGLEVIEIDEKQRADSSAAGTGHQRLLQALKQQTTVWQLGQRVIEGQTIDLVFRCLAIGNIVKNPNASSLWRAWVKPASAHPRPESAVIRTLQTEFFFVPAIDGFDRGIGAIFNCRELIVRQIEYFCQQPAHLTRHVAEYLFGMPIGKLDLSFTDENNTNLDIA